MSSTFFDIIPALAGARHAVGKGAYLFHRDDPVRSVFLVEAGQVALTRFLPDGGQVILQRATGGTILAEASVYASHYHCDAVAEEESRVFKLSRSRFLALLQNDPRMATEWARHLSQALQAARYRSEILCRKTVAQRLDSWLDWQGGRLPPKGQWKSLAAEIGVSPEALYREIAGRR